MRIKNHRGSWLTPLCGVLAFVLAALAAPGSSTHAAGLGVSPTLIDIPDTQMAAGVRVRNVDTARAVNVQARIFRWTQEVGQETYSPTDAVVVSPPVTRIAPGEESLIRVVRTGKQVVQGEDSYRLILDELPDPDQTQESGITLRIRQSIPVFVSQRQATPAQAQWQIERFAEQPSTTASNSNKNHNGHQRTARTGYLVKVTNTGDKRLRLADLTLYDANGVLLAQKQGLVGYALGHSSIAWFILDTASDAAVNRTEIPNRTVTLSVQSERGLIQTTPLTVQTGGT